MRTYKNTVTGATVDVANDVAVSGENWVLAKKNGSHKSEMDPVQGDSNTEKFIGKE